MDALWEAWQQWMMDLRVGGAASLLFRAFFPALVVLGLGAILAIVVWVVSRGPARRARTLLVLGLLEHLVRAGRPIETGLGEVGQTGDRGLGRQLGRLSYWLRCGVPLQTALERERRLLPPEVQAVLRAGLQLGDLPRVLPVCRHLLDRPRSRLLGSMMYVAWVAFGLAPLVSAWILVTGRYIVDHWNQLTGEFGIAQLDYGWWLRWGWLLTAVWLALGVIMLGLILGGPWIRGWMQPARWPWWDAILWRLPWHRKRVLRTFSLVLGTLLDAGMPEAQAVRTAAECTADGMVRLRAVAVEKALAQGQPLPAALRKLEDREELCWRLTNAARTREGFTAALRGWQETLAAQAAAQEQAAVQLALTGLILVSGVWVAGNAWMLFGALVRLVEAVG